MDPQKRQTGLKCLFTKVENVKILNNQAKILNNQKLHFVNVFDIRRKYL